jgi:uncharacterized protein YndB with AHSA1/START domain
MTAHPVEVSTPTDRDIAMSRVFDAPCSLVFQALTRPEYLRQWLLGPQGWTMTVCEVDLKVGGRYRYEWRHEDGREMAMGGSFREIVPDERIVYTERFDEAWYAGEAVTTSILSERNGMTTLIMTSLYESREVRDGVLKSGMTRGVDVSFDRLADVLTSMSAGSRMPRENNLKQHPGADQR